MFSDMFSQMQQSLVVRQSSISVFNLVQESGRLLHCLNGTGTSEYSHPPAWTYRDILAQWERCAELCCPDHSDAQNLAALTTQTHQDPPPPPCTEE